MAGNTTVQGLVGTEEMPRVNKIFISIVVWVLLVLFALGVFRSSQDKSASADKHAFTDVNTAEDALFGGFDSFKDNILESLNLPVSFWENASGGGQKFFYKNSTCSPLPNIVNLSFNNIYWQQLNTSNGTFYMLSAFYDNRTRNPLSVSVRILAMIDRVDPQVKTVCQLWFEDQTEPVFSQVHKYQYLWNRKWGGIAPGTSQPYLITCQIPEGPAKGRIPVALSLVENSCDKAKNLLKVRYESDGGERKDFVVCVKGLDFLHKDLSIRLIEWIELLSILGADKIVMYELQAHSNMSRILRYYHSSGKVEVFPLTLPGSKPNQPYVQHLYLTQMISEKRKHEVIPYNDCLYRNMYLYKYVVLLDLDEVIMPLGNLSSWRELLKGANGKDSSYCVNNVYFLDNMKHVHGWFGYVPRHLHMMQHVYRTRNFTKSGYFVKCFHDTNAVVALHNHFPFACFKNCRTTIFKVKQAQLQHYREDCVANLRNVCKDYRKDRVLDTTIWKYKDQLIARTEQVLSKLKIII